MTNGIDCMEFKKGAFINEKRLKIYTMRYMNDFIPTSTTCSILDSVLLFICNPYFHVEMHEFIEPFDPMYSIESRGLTPGDKDNWKYIVQDVRYLFEYAFKLKMHDIDLDTKIKYECAVVDDVCEDDY